MRKIHYRMIAVLAGVLAIAVTGIGQAVPELTCAPQENVYDPGGGNSIGIHSNAACVVEPLLSRSDAQLVYVNDNEPENLGEANIRDLKLNAHSGRIQAKVRTSEFIPTSPNEFLGTPGGTAGVRPPYGGVHVLVLFQSPMLQQQQIMGPTLTPGGTATFGPYKISDNYHFFFYYGVTLSEGGNPTCGWGVYDQFGQLFTVFSQAHDNPKTFGCVNNKGLKEITFTFPYQTNWVLQPDGLPRTIRFVNTGQSLTNIKAFSWMDHEVGGPPPVGLVVGLTHYTDVLPASGYKFGLWVGDPNSGGIPGPTCDRFIIIGTVPNPLADPTQPCQVSLHGNPVGLGMRPTSLNVSAG